MRGYLSGPNYRIQFIVNEPIAIEVRSTTTGIEFTNKRDLYNNYGIDVKTIPAGYEVKMRYNRVNGKSGRV